MFRVTHNDFERSFTANKVDTLDPNEWDTVGRLDENGWDNRYEYEASLTVEIVSSIQVKTILEVGSGPGILSQKIQTKLSYPVNYHLVDKPFAKKYFDNKKFKGTFFVKDISMDMDVSGLFPVYDLIICNDTLEHLIAPSNVMKKIYSLMHKNSILMISIPNWRMAHQFLYRGLWDYDNFLYFMYIHKLESVAVYPSPLQTPHYPKLNSEETMPDELIQSWNFYFQFKKML